MDQRSPAEPAEATGAVDRSPFSLELASLAAALTVADLDASVAWYSDVLGFTVDRPFERDGVRYAVRVRAGAVELLLRRDDGAKGTGRAKGEGVSFRLTTTGSVDELAARLKARGVALDSEPADVPGARVFQLHDPDGFRFAMWAAR